MSIEIKKSSDFFESFVMSIKLILLETEINFKMYIKTKKALTDKP